jgi:hypothetical protein
MHSERKKLGEFNQNPTDSARSISDSKFRSECKFEEK